VALREFLATREAYEFAMGNRGAAVTQEGGEHIGFDCEPSKKVGDASERTSSGAGEDGKDGGGFRNTAGESVIK
jgi:hypothetical protein